MWGLLQMIGEDLGGDREDQLVSVPLALGIVIKEVCIQDRLHQTTNPTDPVHIVVNKVSEDPVQDVECSVRSHTANKVGSQILELPNLLKHYQLGQDRHTLQPDGGCPQDLHDTILLCRQDAKQKAWTQNVDLVGKAILRPIVGLARWWLGSHQVYQVACTADVDDLHDGVVHRNKAPEQIHVSADEDDGVDLLHPTRNTYAVPALIELEQEQHNARQVEHIST